MLAVAIGTVLGAAPPAAMSAPAATIPIAFRSCGTVTGLAARFELLSHEARCQVAKRVMKRVFTGNGQVRGNPARGLQLAIQGWLCWGEEGGFRCRLLVHGTLPPFSSRHSAALFEACPVGPRVPQWAVLACTRVRTNGTRPPG